MMQLQNQTKHLKYASSWDLCVQVSASVIWYCMIVLLCKHG
jgi:hypothetical protein